MDLDCGIERDEQHQLLIRITLHPILTLLGLPLPQRARRTLLKQRPRISECALRIQQIQSLQLDRLRDVPVSTRDVRAEPVAAGGRARGFTTCGGAGFVGGFGFGGDGFDSFGELAQVSATDGAGDALVLEDHKRWHAGGSFALVLRSLLSCER